ncbi:MAG: 2-nitropropane dioxygenase, partial [Psychromonas sp.]
MSVLSLHHQQQIDWSWKVKSGDVNSDIVAIKAGLRDIQKPVYIAQNGAGLGISHNTSAQGSESVLAFAQALNPEDLGDLAFREAYGVKYAYHGGAMANGIASVELVVALGKAGFLCSFGAAGLVPDLIESSIKRIQAELPNGPYAVNLIHAPAEEA